MTVPVAALLIGVYFLGAWEYINRNAAWVSFDTYQYFYPELVYARAEPAAGGQVSCGTPCRRAALRYFGISSTSTLYPCTALLRPRRRTGAARGVVLNLAIAGIGAYLLCREVGVGRLGAACGVMCFELGTRRSNDQLAPMVAEPYVWLPMSCSAASGCCAVHTRGAPWRSGRA